MLRHSFRAQRNSRMILNCNQGQLLRGTVDRADHIRNLRLHTIECPRCLTEFIVSVHDGWYIKLQVVRNPYQTLYHFSDLINQHSDNQPHQQDGYRNNRNRDREHTEELTLSQYTARFRIANEGR